MEFSVGEINIVCTALDRSVRFYTDVIGFTFDLLVKDIGEAARHFEAHGTEFEKAWEDGASSFMIRDPDGLRIEVIG